MTIDHFYYKNKQISYSVVGDGKPLFLLHGYQSDSRVWNELIPRLTEKYQLIIPDLPGHGKSELVEEVNTMELMADVVLMIAAEAQISDFAVAGHSMGGYVALAMAEKAPEQISQIFLINSHPFADTEKRAKDRKREMRLLDEGKKEILLKSFTQLNFAAGNREKLKGKIEETIEIGLDQPDKGILADINGLMIRKSRASIIEGQRHAVFVVFGAEENSFPREAVRKLENSMTRVVCLPNCSHMILIEQPGALAKVIN